MLFMTSGRVPIDISLGIDHIVKIANLVELDSLHSHKLRVGVVAVLGQLHSVALALTEVNVAN